MASTYLELTNKLLRKFNEVEITSDLTFDSVRGVQAVAKDAIKDAVKKINQFQYEWPFNAYEHTETLSVGVVEYAWPDNFKVVEWESFFLIKDDTLGVGAKPLRYMSREDWYRYNRNDDVDSGVDGRNQPIFVFPSHGNGFGITPAPDKEYTIKYRYFRDPPELINPSDEVIIPTQWDNVIVAMATPDMHEFRSNVELAAYSQKSGMDQLDQMRAILINKYLRVYDGRVNQDRFRFSGGYIDAR